MRSVRTRGCLVLASSIYAASSRMLLGIRASGSEFGQIKVKNAGGGRRYLDGESPVRSQSQTDTRHR